MKFGSNPLMAQLMRGSTQNTSPIFSRATQAVATRGGGGGSFHRPDPQPYALYKYTRRYHLQDINSVIYGDFAPEFHMHLHSMWIQDGKRGWFLLFSYFMLVMFPCWCITRTLMKNSGAEMIPTVRSSEAHAHMMPALWSHLKNNNCEKAKDKFGRSNADFYKNWVRQDNAKKNGFIT